MDASTRFVSYVLIGVTTSIVWCAPSVYAQDRMPPLGPDDMTAERGTATLRGPWVPLLRAPEVLGLMLDMRSHVRDRSVLGQKLTELAILVAAREWTQQYEWSAHVGAAEQAGLDPIVITAIAEGRRPPKMSAEEASLYDLCMELHRNKSVSDDTYDRALAAFGQEGVVEAVTIEGYYALLAMVMNTARTPLPAGREPGLMAFPR